MLNVADYNLEAQTHKNNTNELRVPMQYTNKWMYEIHANIICYSTSSTSQKSYHHQLSYHGSLIKIGTQIINFELKQIIAVLKTEYLLFLFPIPHLYLIILTFCYV